MDNLQTSNYMIDQSQRIQLIELAQKVGLVSLAGELSNLTPITRLSDDKLVEIGNEVGRSMRNDADPQEELLKFYRECEDQLLGERVTDDGSVVKIERSEDA